jgi:drug/metabolite transporter (DMT)-like permease
VGAAAIAPALTAAALSSILVGAGIAVSRLAVAEVQPLTLAMLRYAIGGACLLPFAMREAHELFTTPPLHGRKRDLAGMAAIGILQFGVLIALLNFALQHTGAAEAALIFSLFPLLTMLFSTVAGREKITTTLVAGVAVSITGVALSLAPKLGTHGHGDWWGELAVVAAATIGAACSVLYRPYLQRYPTVPVSALAMLASVGLLAIAALSETWPQRITGFSGIAWGATVFVGVSSAIGYFMWLYALKHETPTRVTVFLALNPPAAALCGWLLLGEPIHAAVAGALVLVGAGLWLATRPTPVASR